MIIRSTEWAEHEEISLLNIDGFGEGTFKLLYESEINTASKIMNMPTSELLEKLSALGGFIKKCEKHHRLIEDWKRKIRSAWTTRTQQPLPPNWDDASTPEPEEN